MVENQENNICCCDSCCHYKKIFMLLVLLFLAFISGIMIGCCGGHNHSTYSYTPQIVPAHHLIPHAKKFHRGSQQTSPNNTNSNENQSIPNAQIGGFIIEVDQAQ